MAADIGSAKIRADYDELANIANELGQESQAVEQLASQIVNLVGQLQSGGWIGRGAEAFYGEMQDLVEPGMRRLIRALEDSSNAVKQISNIFSQAEQDASGLFSRDSASITPINLP
jgi:WXG100 family type VII secretion target